MYVFVAILDKQKNMFKVLTKMGTPYSIYILEWNLFNVYV